MDLVQKEMKELEKFWNASIQAKIDAGMTPEEAYNAVCKEMDEKKVVGKDGKVKGFRVSHRNFAGNGETKQPTNE